MQLLLDGSDSTAAGIIAAYSQVITQAYAGEVALEQQSRVRLSAPRVPVLDGRLRVWYNPELKSINYMVPGVLCNVLMFISTILTALAIVREKEVGTLEQLIVSPITAGERILGKTLPFLFLGFLETALVLGVAIGWFHVHVAGSILLLFALSILFLLSMLGLGIFISTISQTQQEATLTSFSPAAANTSLRLHVPHREYAPRHPVCHLSHSAPLFPGDHSRDIIERQRHCPPLAAGGRAGGFRRGYPHPQCPALPEKTRLRKLPNHCMSRHLAPP